MQVTVNAGQVFGVVSWQFSCRPRARMLGTLLCIRPHLFSNTSYRTSTVIEDEAKSLAPSLSRFCFAERAPPLPDGPKDGEPCPSAVPLLILHTDDFTSFISSHHLPSIKASHASPCRTPSPTKAHHGPSSPTSRQSSRFPRLLASDLPLQH